MAYNFDGVDDRVDFNNAPLLGYVFGPCTLAAYVKLSGSVLSRPFVGIREATDSVDRILFRSHTSSQPRLLVAAAAATHATTTVYTAGVWTLAVVTWGGAGTTPRHHLNTGSGWAHTAFSSAIAGNAVAIGAGDKLAFGKYSTLFFAGDCVCVGIKKADMSDVAVEALSLTSWAAWQAFGFDWLAGFETAAAIQDQGTAGTGDEIARTGTTLVSNPPGWVWTPTDTTPPSAPTGLTATPDYSTETDLAWTASTDAVGVTGYKVERKTGAGSFAEIATPTGTAYHDTGLTPATAYVYRVRARDAAGNLSGYTSEVTVTTAWYADPATTYWVPLFTPP